MSLTQIISYVSARVDDFNTRVCHAQRIADTIDHFADRHALKKRKGELLKVQTKYNEDYRAFEKEVSRMVYDRLSELEGLKNADGRLTGYDEEVRQLYLLLHEYGGRFNSRYVKMPGEWLSLGMKAGLLEDMIVVLRTPVQIGLGNKHMYSLTEFVRGFKEFLGRDDENCERFMFLTNLLEPACGVSGVSMDDIRGVVERVMPVIDSCVAAQGNSKRIGVFKEEEDTYYYAIQGIIGNMYDARVTRVLDAQSAPDYAVHFTKNYIARAIWNCEPTRGKRTSARKDLQDGAICKFERSIHALTNVAFSDGKYRIFDVDKDIRDRMAHGIKTDVERPKYQAGLVIDVKRLVSTLPEGSVLMNEIGTLLVNADIPRDCLLYCIESEQDVEAFWSGC